MSLLVKELLELLAEEARSFDLEELAKTFKNPVELKKHVQKLWGSKHMTFKGQEFFSGNSFGPVYNGALKTGEKELKNYKFEAELELKGEFYSANLEVDDQQEVYLGYDPKDDKLYIGFDIWVRDEGLETAFEEMYQDAFDEEINDSSEEFHQRFKEFQDDNGIFYGALIELNSQDGKKFTGDVVATEKDGFYKGIYNKTLKSLKLVDLRLD